MYEMLTFAASKEIRPMIEKFKLSEVNSAIEKLRSGRVRYRAVLETDE